MKIHVEPATPPKRFIEAVAGNTWKSGGLCEGRTRDVVSVGHQNAREGKRSDDQCNQSEHVPPTKFGLMLVVDGGQCCTDKSILALFRPEYSFLHAYFASIRRAMPFWSAWHGTNVDLRLDELPRHRKKRGVGKIAKSTSILAGTPQRSTCQTLRQVVVLPVQGSIRAIPKRLTHPRFLSWNQTVTFSRRYAKACCSREDRV
jgi:hypothetical protein